MVDDSGRDRDLLRPADPDQERAARVDVALSRLVERHAGTGVARRRQDLASLVAAHEVVRLVSLVGGGAVDLVEGEPVIDTTDLTAAMTLLPVVRAEVDELEASVLFLARDAGMTWSQIAFALGMRSTQAAQQRAERLSGRGENMATGASRDPAVDAATSRGPTR